MATGRGVDILLGTVKQAVWTNVGVSCNAAGLGIRPTSFTYDEVVEELPDESYNGNPLRNDTTNTGRYRVSGTIGFDLKIQGLEVALANLFGVDTKTGAGPDYTHLLSTKSDMSNISATIAWWDGIHVHEIPAAKFNRLVLRGTAGGVMTGELGFIGRTRSENAANNLDANKLGSMAAISLSNWEVRGSAPSIPGKEFDATEADAKALIAAKLAEPAKPASKKRTARGGSS